jgi:hypothetical protein
VLQEACLELRKRAIQDRGPHAPHVTEQKMHIVNGVQAQT